MRYAFLTDTYETARLIVLSTWAEFHDDDLPTRPRPDDPRGRSILEQMVHQCVSEDLWFRNMLAIDVNAPPLPATETRLDFIKRYAEDSAKRSQAFGSPKTNRGSKATPNSSTSNAPAPGSSLAASPTPPTTAANKSPCSACYATICTAITAPPPTPAASCKITPPQSTPTPICKRCWKENPPPTIKIPTTRPRRKPVTERPDKNKPRAKHLLAAQ